MADFDPGTKVICVRAGFHLTYPGILAAWPTKGTEYVVRAVAMEKIPFEGRPPTLGIRLHWIINPIIRTNEGVLEPYFAVIGLDGAPNFRPVIDRKTSISELEKLLLTKDVREPENV